MRIRRPSRGETAFGPSGELATAADATEEDGEDGEETAGRRGRRTEAALPLHHARGEPNPRSHPEDPTTATHTSSSKATTRSSKDGDSHSHSHSSSRRRECFPTCEQAVKWMGTKSALNGTDEGVDHHKKPPDSSEDEGEEEEDEHEDSDSDDDDDDDDDEAAEPVVALYKSRRFKGYLTICLASILNYNAASKSDEPIDDKTVIPAGRTQKNYALSVSLISAVVTGVLVLMHLDRYSPLQSLWRRTLSKDSRVESTLVVSLMLWWAVAAIVQTSVRGIAGDGKAQYNLYYSTWVCCWTCLWNAERKLKDYGFPTFRSFVTSWPNRAPGWIAIFLTDFFTLWWYVDLFVNTQQNPDRVPEPLVPFYESIPRSQYQWLIFVSAITLLPCAIFIAVEILRKEEEEVEEKDEPARQGSEAKKSPTGNRMATWVTGISAAPTMWKTTATLRTGKKSSGEIILEGCCLISLTVGWIPSVIVATTPGGFASSVGNAYYCTWVTTVFVLETFLWFIHDWRGSVHRALERKEQEYRQHQQRVLQDTLAKVHHAAQQTPGAEADGDYYHAHARPQEDSSIGEDWDPPFNDDDDDDDMEEEEEEEDAKRDSDLRNYRLEDYFADSSRSPPSSPPRFPSDILPDEDDGSIANEIRMKEDNVKAYFDTLNDILE